MKPSSTVLCAMVAAVASVQSTEGKPKIHWGVNIGQYGTMHAGNGIAATDDFLFVANQDCSLVTLNRTNGDVLNVYEFEDPAFPNNTLICDAIPLVYSHDGNEFVVYSSQKGHVIATNFDGTAKWNATVGTGRVENVRIDRTRSAILVAHNEGSDGRITFLDPADGSINQDIGQTITDDTITGLSDYGVASGLGDVHFATGRATANVYRLTLGESFPDPDSVVLEATGKAGAPDQDSKLPRFPPALWGGGSPIPSLFVPAANEHLYSFLEEYGAHEYRKTDTSEQSGFNFGAPVLLKEQGSQPDMVCWGRFNYNCVDRNTGCHVWSRSGLIKALSGDPNVYVYRDQKSETILFDDLRSGILLSLDPATGEEIWSFSCLDKDYEDVGYSCVGTDTEGRGAMAVSRDKDLVYFSPAPGWIMAADVFLPDGSMAEGMS